MALTEAENDWLTVVLENLSERRQLLNPREQDFLDSTIARHSQYDIRTMVSPKQFQWLGDIHKRYCPDAELPDPEGGTQLSEPDNKDQDDDDDAVPF